MDLNNSNNENLESFALESLNLDYGDEEKKIIEEETGDNKQRMKSLFKQLELELDNVKKYANIDIDMPLKDVDANKMPQISYKNNYNDNQLGQNNEQKIFVEANNGNDNENYENDGDNVRFKNINYTSAKSNNNNNDNNNFIENNNIIDNDNNMVVNQINSNSNTDVILKEMSKNNNNDNNFNNNNDNNNFNENDMDNDNDNEKPTIVTSIRVNNVKELDNILSSNNLNQEIQDEMRKESQFSKNQLIDDLNERREQELKEIEEMKKRQEEEYNKKMEELQRKEEEMKRREEEFNSQMILENERRKKEEEERKRRIKEEDDERRKKVEEEERRRKAEEEQRKKEEEEEEQRDRLLIEEENRLKREEKEKEEEEKRENERIKRERLLKEQKEKEEEERKKKEEEQKKKLEIQKKEEELQQEKELKEEMKKNIEENDEVIIKDMDEDDIEELEEEVSYTETSNFRSRIKQSITKSALPKNNLKSINQSLNNNPKFKSQMLKKNNNIDMEDSINSELSNKEESKKNNNDSIKDKTTSVNKSINLKNKSFKNSKVPKPPKSDVKKSIEDSKLPKQQKEPEKEIRDKSLRDSQSLYENQTKFENSDIFKKLPEDLRNKVMECIKNVEEFDTAHPNLDDAADYPYIDKFQKDEKPLSEVISDYEEKFVNLYDDEYLKNKVQTNVSGELFEDDQKVVGALIDAANIPSETHIDVIKKKYQKEKLKNLPKTEDSELNDIETKLFSDDEFLTEFNCPFSKLENLQTFIYKYSAHENPKLMGVSANNFNNWRMTLSDGNSFYRVNMFAIIENCIFESNSELLSAILNEMTSDEFIKVYKKKSIEYEKPFSILSAILALIVNGMEEKAYDLFLKAYELKNGCFDLLLIVYLKRVLYVFSEEINKLLKEKKKTAENKDVIDKALINLDEIDNLYIDPKITMFYLMSYIFDMNIYILSVYNKFLKPKDSLKKVINEEEDSSVPTFIFGYFFSSYHILYQSKFNHKIFNNKIEQDNPQITQLTFITKEKAKCNMCKKETRHIIFLRKKFIVCEPCLKNYLMNEILKERKASFLEEKCFGKEYYSRPIHLKGDFYLDDYEYIEIFEESNIINEICRISQCLICQKSSLDDSSLIHLDCGCTYCSNCFENIFKDITKGKGYLLEIESKLYSNKNLTCGCKKKYYYHDLEKFHEKNEDEDEEQEAEERKKDYITKYCMSCFKDLEQKDSKVKKIKMRKDSNMLDHFMCTECYNINFKNKPPEEDEEEEEEENEDDTRDMAKDSNSKIRIVNKDDQTVQCRICSEVHKYIEDTGNCACLIF